MNTDISERIDRTQPPTAGGMVSVAGEAPEEAFRMTLRHDPARWCPGFLLPAVGITKQAWEATWAAWRRGAESELNLEHHKLQRSASPSRGGRLWESVSMDGVLVQEHRICLGYTCVYLQPLQNAAAYWTYLTMLLGKIVNVYRDENAICNSMTNLQWDCDKFLSAFHLYCYLAVSCPRWMQVARVSGLANFYAFLGQEQYCSFPIKALLNRDTY